MFTKCFIVPSFAFAFIQICMVKQLYSEIQKHPPVDGALRLSRGLSLRHLFLCHRLLRHLFLCHPSLRHLFLFHPSLRHMFLCHPSLRHQLPDFRCHEFLWLPWHHDVNGLHCYKQTVIFLLYSWRHFCPQFFCPCHETFLKVKTCRNREL